MTKKCLIMLMIFSSFSVGICQDQGGGGGSGGMGDEPPCMKNLLPCTLYLHKRSAPPSICCVPVKQLVADDLKCLCDVFTNPVIRISLNVTQADAMDLVKRCGGNADASMCKNAGPSAPTGSPSPSNSSSPSTNTNSTAGAPPESAGIPLSKFGCSSSLLIIFYFIVSIL